MAEVTDKMKRAFVIDCWNGMMDDIRATLAAHPEAANWKDFNGSSGLTNAVAHGSHKMNVAELLLAHGANPDIRNGDGETCLMIAAGQSYGQDTGLGMGTYVPWLLANGADATLTDNSGRTAAEIATAKGNHKMAALLAEHAAAQAADRASPKSGILKPLAVGKPFQLKR